MPLSEYQSQKAQKMLCITQSKKASPKPQGKALNQEAGLGYINPHLELNHAQLPD